MASTQAEWPPHESAGPTLASVCSKWSTIFASSGEKILLPAARERNPQPHPQIRRLTMQRLRRRQLLSEAGGAEVLDRRAPPERVGVEEAPGVAAVERKRRANASGASPPPPVSAATTQVGLVCVSCPRHRLLCQSGRRLAQSQRHDRCQSART